MLNRRSKADHEYEHLQRRGCAVPGECRREQQSAMNTFPGPFDADVAQLQLYMAAVIRVGLDGSRTLELTSESFSHLASSLTTPARTTSFGPMTISTSPGGSVRPYTGSRRVPKLTPSCAELIGLNPQPDIIELISWNDYGESHYVGPLNVRFAVLA